MSDTLTHKFISAKPDGPDVSVIRPSNWNDEHAFAGGATGELLLFDEVASDKVGWLPGAAAGRVLLSQGPGVAPIWSAALPLAGDTITMPIDGEVVTVHRVGVTELTPMVASPVLTIALPDGAATGGTLELLVVGRNAAGHRDVAKALVHFAMQRTGSDFTCALESVGSGVVTKSHAGHDMSVTADADASSGTGIALTLLVTSALVLTDLRASWRLAMLASHGTIS